MQQQARALPTGSVVQAQYAKPAVDDAELSRQAEELNKARVLCYRVGTAQLVLAVLGIFVSFSYVTNALAIASGVINRTAW